MAETTIKVGERELTFPSKKEMLKDMGRRILSRSDEPMTLRQLYYRFVAMDLLDNKQSQYSYLGEAIKEARLEGTVPWGWIEDRTRGSAAGDHPKVDPDDRFEGNLEWFKETPDRYKRPRWEDQPEYVEVWVEKEALAGVFKRVCDELGVISFPCRGYSSITMLKEAADRIDDATSEKVPPLGDYREATILYFGDFDPSGQDIERNIRETLDETFGVEVNIERQALTRAQIDEHELPPQPAKRSDSRYETFVEEHGDMAVELDALPPEELRQMIRGAVGEHFDDGLYQDDIEPKEEEHTERIRERVDSVLAEGHNA